MNNLLTIDTAKIYNDILTNLKINDLNTNSTIYKVVQPIIDEMDSFLAYANNLVKEMSISTASFATLQREGSEYGIFRRSFNELNIDKTDEAIQITLTDFTSFVEVSNTLLFKSGDSVTIGNISVTFLEDLFIQNNNDTPYASVKIKLINVDTFYIPSNTTYVVTPTNNSNIIPTLNISFLKNIGIVNIQESVEDFRIRLLDAKTLPYRNINSILNQLILEVPGISRVETDNIQDTSFTTVYVFTNTLLTNGVDQLIDQAIVPSVQTVLSDKLDNKYNLEIKQAVPLDIILNIKFKEILFNEEKLRRDLNIVLTSIKTINKEFILSLLSPYINEVKDFNLELKSIDIFEENINLNLDNEITIPQGRFFYISKVTGV